MASAIHLLPDSVVNQIAAGEVIQRPASIVKELVENSIDAGATDVKVVIRDAGRTLVQVVDNGCGMNESDARLAFERHATSKIQDANDLYSLHSMGFRGEALASIAAVAQVELLTRKEEDDLGVKIDISASVVEQQMPVQTAKGTQFCVKNLFYNVPARRRFLKSDNVEMRHIITEFQRVALAHPDVALTLMSNDVAVYRLTQGNHKQRVVAMAGKALGQQLLPISTETSVVKISGFIGSPETAKKSGGDQFFFVNDRFMKHPYFHRAVMDAYKNIIQTDTIPAYFIYMNVDPNNIDVNIHPQKTEIKFEDENAIWKILNACVRESLGKFNAAPSIDFDTSDSIDIPPMRNDFASVTQPTISSDVNYNPFVEEMRDNNQSAYSAPRFNKPQQNAAGWEGLYETFSSKSNDMPLPDISNSAVTIKPDAAPTQQTFFESGMNSSVVGTGAKFFQFKGRYIITQVKSGLMFIDQHRAHERVQYDMLASMIEKRSVPSQQLIFPEIITIGAEDACVIEEISDELLQAGLEVFFDSEQGQLQVKAVPAVIDASDVHLLIDTLLYDYKNGNLNLHSGVMDYVLRMLASQSAIAYGKILTNEEMCDLFDRLFACKLPNYSPQGKPVVIIFETSDIESRF